MQHADGQLIMVFVSSSGVRIHYEVEGRGPALVLHTGGGGDHRMWELAGYTRALEGYRKILIDQRGRGRSDRPADQESHRMECFVDDVNAVMDDAGVDSAGFWGYSDGSLVGMAFADAHPGRLKALVGTGGVPYLNLSELPKPVDRQAEIERIAGDGGVMASLKRFMERENDRFPDPIYKNVAETDPRMNALDDVAWMEWNGPRAVCQKLRIPVLLIAGEKEDLKGQTEKIAAEIPNGRVIRLAGMGHLGAFYRNDVALSHALPFLKEHLR
jgi:pimeloyl-ACP methyl ester carboxylesterase